MGNPTAAFQLSPSYEMCILCWAFRRRVIFLIFCFVTQSMDCQKKFAQNTVTFENIARV